MKQVKKIKFGDLFNAETIAFYSRNPIAFTEDIIFMHNPEYLEKFSDQSKEILKAICSYKRVAVKSGKGIGKTATCVFALLWYLTTHKNPKIIVTGPSYGTLKTGFWTELSQWVSRCSLKHIFEITSEKIELIENPKNWYGVIRSSSKKENLQGIHSDNLFIIVDEASGVEDEIIETVDSTLSSASNKIILIGNPTRVGNFFYRCFHADKRRWHNYTFSAPNSPLVSEEQIEYYKDKYKENHPLYLVDILGEFPEGNSDAYISLGEVQDAINRDVAPKGKIEIGVDVARFGDDYTVLWWRHGMKVYGPEVLPKSSTPEVVDLVLLTVKKIRKETSYSKTITIKIDSTGVGGGVEDYLRLDTENDLEIISCNFGGPGNEHFKNETSIMWGEVKDALKHASIPDHKELKEELSTRRFSIPDGRICIEPKKDYKREYKRSPDFSDALCLLFAHKKPENVVLKKFDPVDSSYIIQDTSYAGDALFGSVWTSKNMTFSTVYGRWNGSVLTVVDEFVCEDDLVYLAMNLQQHHPITKIIGNDVMFGVFGEDLSSKLRKFKVRLFKNIKYDELGSIQTLSTFVNFKQVKIHSKCQTLIKQMSRWKIEGPKSKLEADYGLCYSLTNMLSFLKRMEEYKQQEQVFAAYSGEKENFLKNFNRNEPFSEKNAWMAR